ncbi:filamentous hemagglutinin N-terminal domain-containing protein [Lusitaniella coriacea LEGE 07157]|uniref:Filamentous hemagglutinin N-terminal domain-containing protein n=1 Tax=Lusitaniella coriacea LEGE 07157 TaxID=945747 RepID=A0A8J7E074_9CYAN|nr:filamentous hemagglutinin N-terminal domain-containing protein [Lusitaniella coriacea]MBE9118081.1 filamentous hemagglutinin N-terminal domain-containing protein [Lusitaniella coriacea LEGE 07157]
MAQKPSRPRTWVHWCLLGSVLFGLTGERTVAQILPDNTLGDENSTLTNATITGGAARGSNLFHSFSEFNINNGQSVYFANPNGIANILTRVTGGNPSNILGTLGVNGTANLFLLNPNGILFGPNSQLDIRGSFVATTADSILFDNGFAFSAANPQTPSLLTVSVPLGLQYGTNNTGIITNRGNLAVGENFTLNATQLDLQGTVQSGGDLTLQGTDTVTIRDTATTPFIAAAGGKLVVQGNQTLDIFALNHPDSGFFSGGEMVLRSDDGVSGDAHYWSGGNFRIEQLDGSLGDLYSPYDPIFVVKGDININNYVGASLHIFAGGEVDIGTVTITAPDPSLYSIHPGHPNPLLASLASVLLPDGTTQTIRGNIQPTLDIRAGIDAAVIDNILNNIGLPSLGFGFYAPPGTPFPGGGIGANPPNSANITINTIQIDAPDGLVYLTNRYEPAQGLNGNITVNGSINTQVTSGDSGKVILDSRNDLRINGTINTSSTVGNPGDVEVFSDNVFLEDSIIKTGLNNNIASFGNGDITFDANNIFTIGAVALLSNNDISIEKSINGSSLTGDGSNLTLKAKNNISVLGYINTMSTATVGNGGNVELNAGGNISLAGDIITASINGEGGNISLSGENLGIFNSLNSSSISGNAGNISLISIGDSTILSEIKAQSSMGFGGGVAVNAGQNLNILYSTISTSSNFLGSGDIEINARNGNLALDNSFIQSETFGIGNAGVIDINSNTIRLQNNARISASTRDLGNASKIEISARELNVETGSRIYSNTNNVGNAGQIELNILNSLKLDRAFVFVNTFQGTGNAGNLEINTPNFTAQNGSLISAASQGGGIGGNVQINASGGRVNFIGNDPVVLSANDRISPTALVLGSFGGGTAGNLTIDTRQLIVENGALVYGSADRVSGDNAASITVRASESVQVLGTTPNGQLPSSLSSDTFGAGNAGNLIILTPHLVLRDGGQVSAGTTGTGQAGTLGVRANFVEITGTSRDGQRPSQLLFDSFGSGDAGEFRIDTGQLLLQNGGRISARTGGTGRGGIIAVNALNSVQISGTSGSFASGLIFESNGAGDARGIRIQTPGDLTVENGGKITVGGTGSGVSGDLDISARNIFLTNQGQLGASTRAARGGSIRLQVAENIVLRYNSEISAEAFGTSRGGNINMKVGGFIRAVLPENSDVVASAESGQGGKIFADTRQIFGFRQFNGRRTPESDFTAISEPTDPSIPASSGTVEVIVRDFQPVINLPDRFVDPQLDEGCRRSQGRTGNQSKKGRFDITGLGGLPPNPRNALSNNTVQVPWLTLEDGGSSAASPEVVEAQGWVKLPDGRTILTAEDPAIARDRISCGLR